MSEKVIGYKVVKALEVERLIEKVNYYLEQGWELLGPPGTFGTHLTQAMVQHSKPEATQQTTEEYFGKRPAPVSADPDDFYHR